MSAEPARWLDRKGRPCPDPDPIRKRYALHGCSTFVVPLKLDLPRVAVALIVEEGGDLAIMLNSEEPEGGRLGVLAHLHQALADPTNPVVPWYQDSSGGWSLMLQWRHAAERGEVVDQALGRQGHAAHVGARCLASTQAGHRCTCGGGWVSSGFCWQHWRFPIPSQQETA